MQWFKTKQLKNADYTKHSPMLIMFISERNMHKDFVYKLNQSMLPDNGVKWTWEQVKQITGIPVEQLWEQYQDEMHLNTI